MCFDNRNRQVELICECREVRSNRNNNRIFDDNRIFNNDRIFDDNRRFDNDRIFNDNRRFDNDRIFDDRNRRRCNRDW